METPIPCSAEEEHIFRSQHPAVPVPDITVPDFVLQDAELALRSLGLRKGRVMIVALPNVAEYGIVALGIMASGGVFSGANQHYLLRCGHIKNSIFNGVLGVQVKGLGLPMIVLGEMCIITAMNWNELLDAADRTTGMSKGVMLTHRNLVANLCSSLFSVDPEMVGHVATRRLIPFFHTYGITGICCATRNGESTAASHSLMGIPVKAMAFAKKNSVPSPFGTQAHRS
ncbi:hypothetical protein POTOM_014328 [Populus tomentosa]|uniref:AMP-dependent synthetase/ligase domain-containing protein n=1 Tax=Populus tomentosa TaxID=118781 RepID=A0A8X8A6I1_POPTO|nr:hypothetical protein POTOM_014328 [Populus tomentosa]